MIARGRLIKRWLLIFVTVIVAGGLIGSIGLWIFLSSWVPVHGKALLIRELERRAPISVSMETLRYDFFHGFLCTGIRVTERTTQESWGLIPSLQLRVRWLPLVLRSRLAFHGRASLETPCRTTLVFSGRMGLRDHSLAVDVQTAEVPFASISAPLTRLLPPPLTEGTLQGQLHVRQTSMAHSTLTAQVEGTELVWASPSWRLHGDVMVDGVATPPSQPGERWSFQAGLTLRRGTLEGIPQIGSISALEGTARLAAEHLDIETLTGTMLGSVWNATGTILLGAQPTFESQVSSETNLKSLAAAFPAITQMWQPEGATTLQSVCRGRVGPSPFIDCLVRGQLREATLAGPKLVYPLTRMNGRVEYDGLTQSLSVGRLEGRLNGEPFTISGNATMGRPAFLDLHLTSTLPLDSLTPWLPPARPVDQLGGVASLDLALRGPVTHLQSTGQMTLRDATARFTTAPLTVEQAFGVITFTEERLSISHTTFHLNGQPLAVQATISPFPTAERIRSPHPPQAVVTVDLPHGQLQLDGQITLDDLKIDAADFSAGETRLHLTGTMSRTNERPSTLVLTGTIELESLNSIPFLSLEGLESWNLKGRVALEAQLTGTLADWTGAALQGRLRSDHVSVRDIPLDEVLCAIEQRDRLLHLRIPSTLLADGKLIGEFTLRHHPTTTRYELQVDLIGVQLAQLSHAIPAWRHRTVTGTLSSHATLSGTWQNRSSWQGDGWLNAGGEQLGDVPLLDHVFQGLFGVLADRLSLESLRRAQLTNASAQWRLDHERFQTTDFRLGGLAGSEVVAVYASGSVGFDRTLDFVIEPELSEGTILEAPTTSTIASTVLKAAGHLERFRRLIGRHRLTGTLDNPEYRFEFTTQDILKQLAPGPIDLLHNLLDAIR